MSMVWNRIRRIGGTGKRVICSILLQPDVIPTNNKKREDEERKEEQVCGKPSRALFAQHTRHIAADQHTTTKLSLGASEPRDCLTPHIFIVRSQHFKCDHLHDPLMD
ncbi:unnamed protein product [Allacma fusca]|uniref:Uncharacterized protein n=1 Tax=Allacma fusca TaxID=39272 RepID=A0A8J2P0V5_9HEXA|nr:unnamed protein product [Allacma fusca]